jgi:hypothetical protein
VDVKPTTLSKYLDGKSEWVLVEHARCRRSLGPHLAVAFDRGVSLERSDKVRTDRPWPEEGLRGPLTNPGIYPDPRWPGYSRVHCPCLPAHHDEKIRDEKLGTLPVTFPDWKWGRAIDMPVVTF